MSALPITVSAAGYAALVNAENTGTNPVLISQIGITDVSFAPSTGLSSLPGEIKRLTTFAGAVVAPDTVHVTIRDDSEEVYSLRGFALYLEDGTLFASYGQASVILEKSSLAMLLLAADVRFTNIDAALLEFGDTNWINPPATTEVKGVVELATPEETVSGIDPARATTPFGIKAVLDARFGAGAPSAFFKGLMTAATVTVLRAALGLGSAAVRNEGTGSGLDADLLDGQHGAFYQAWANMTGVPATFAPSAHTHQWANITGVPIYTTRWADWSEISGKPATFTPSSHAHAAADVTTGIFDVARIPDIPQAKVAGLVDGLAAKAALAGAEFTGKVIVSGAITGGHFSARNHAGANVLDIGMGATTSADPDAFIVNRTNGGLLFYTNNIAAAKINASGSSSWNYDMNIGTGGALYFGSATRQMVNLYGSTYGIGVQGNTWYARTGSGFNFYKGGVHAPAENDAGLGGTSLMRIDGAGSVIIPGNYYGAGSWISNSANAIISSLGGGIFLRPNGNASGTGQALLTSDGTLSLSGNLAVIGTAINAIGASGQGNQIVWNSVSGGSGRTEFVNNFGGGSGGFSFYSRSTTSSGMPATFVHFNVNGDITARDYRANRGDGTGVYYFSTVNDRYLYWNGATYILNGAGLQVGGAVSAPKFSRSSSKRYKEAIETISPEKAAALLSTFRWTEYRLKSDGSCSVGAIAEELADGPLDFVVERNSDGEPDSINYDPLFALACAVLNGVLDRVSALEERVF